VVRAFKNSARKLASPHHLRAHPTGWGKGAGPPEHEREGEKLGGKNAAREWARKTAIKKGFSRTGALGGRMGTPTGNGGPTAGDGLRGARMVPQMSRRPAGKGFQTGAKFGVGFGDPKGLQGKSFSQFRESGGGGGRARKGGGTPCDFPVPRGGQIKPPGSGRYQGGGQPFGAGATRPANAEGGGQFGAPRGFPLPKSQNRRLVIFKGRTEGGGWPFGGCGRGPPKLTQIGFHTGPVRSRGGPQKRNQLSGQNSARGGVRARALRRGAAGPGEFTPSPGPPRLARTAPSARHNIGGPSGSGEATPTSVGNVGAAGGTSRRANLAM